MEIPDACTYVHIHVHILIDILHIITYQFLPAKILSTYSGATKSKSYETEFPKLITISSGISDKTFFILMHLKQYKLFFPQSLFCFYQQYKIIFLFMYTHNSPFQSRYVYFCGDIIDLLSF